MRKRRISSMKKYLLDNLPAIWVVAVFVLGMALAANHASADEKKTITLDQVSTTVSELPTKVSSWGKSEWEKTKDFQKKSWAEAKTKWPWNQIFKGEDNE